MPPSVAHTRNKKQVATSDVPADNDQTTADDPVMAARTPAVPGIAVGPPSVATAPSAFALDANPIVPSPTHPDHMVTAVQSGPSVPPVVDYHLPVPVAPPANNALCYMF
jgi:hypothetical protein